MLSGRPGHHLSVREITFWHWGFELALLLPAPALLLLADTSADVGVLEFVVVLVIDSLASLLVSTSVVWLALSAAYAAFRLAGFMAELLCLCE